ncbi:MAG: DUF1573 domain-containing protein [Bacteroidota bacterium]
MKKIMILSAVLFTALFSQAQTLQNLQVDPLAKVLEFKNAEYNFGKITLGKPVSYDVEIKNISNDTITLSNAKAGCGCTTPNFVANQRFGPGQTIKVTIQFNGSVAGQFTRFTDINFSNGLSKQTRFTGEGVSEAPPAPATTQQAAQEKAKTGNH